MNVSERTIAALGAVITGDGGISPRNSGPKLVRFFNEFGFNDVYGPGFPSRWDYAERKLRALNGKPLLARVITEILNPLRYLGTMSDPEDVVRHLNKYLGHDGYEIVKSGDAFAVRDLRGALIELEIPPEEFPILGHRHIEEQIKKCDKKILEGDYDGAITNARTLLEQVLLEVECQLKGEKKKYDGNLPRLFRRVKAQLLVSNQSKNLPEILKQILGSLTGVVDGLAGLRNAMSDAHAAEIKPEKHHAKLAVNASKTVSDFIIESYLLFKDVGRE